METIIVYPKNQDQLVAFIAVAKAMKVEFETSKKSITIESPYNAQFVAKIKKGDEEIKNGEFVKIAVEDLWKKP